MIASKTFTTARSAIAAIQRRSLASVVNTYGQPTTSAPSAPKTAVNTAPLTPATAPSATLRLSTNQVFKGKSFGASAGVVGETVFTTSLVGYPESMTDPSYRGQILVFTQPLVGNYGVPGASRDQFGLLKYFESSRIQCQGIVVADYAWEHSHWNSVESLSDWCIRHGVPAITGVDTRALVHLLRGQGSTLASIQVDGGAAAPAVTDPNAHNLVAQVSTTEPYVINPSGDVHIAAVDCGMKNNILRSLAERGARVTVLPWDYNFNKHADQFDALFLSNGPGSPTHCTATVRNLRTAMQSPDAFRSKPIFGICMGNQLMGLAAGLQVYKLPFGNRGHNQPCVDLTKSGRCVITSQNHGYALADHYGDTRYMPEGWERYFVNANDGSNEGIRHMHRPHRSVQFHPEAKGGPRDTMYLFDDFVDEARWYKRIRERSTFAIPAHVPIVSASAPSATVAATAAAAMA
ncbi:small subunit of carbamoyl phosphate synthase [Ramicandelaber brevisporus]|nr:small subunit of carbamoyl phosphate synthase [Ramicandelaber brevisporus]